MNSSDDYARMLIVSPDRISKIRQCANQISEIFLWAHSMEGNDFWKDLQLRLCEIADGAEAWQKEQKS